MFVHLPYFPIINDFSKQKKDEKEKTEKYGFEKETIVKLLRKMFGWVKYLWGSVRLQ